MPTRSRSQLIGDRGEGIVHQLVDTHPSWLCRKQDRDFGIDFEAELALSDGESQSMKGKLLKLQVKASDSREIRGDFVPVSLDREYLEYASQFRLPVILVAVDLQTGAAWWTWLQEWLLHHERHMWDLPNQQSFTVNIPIEQTLASGLDQKWKDIAQGREETSVILGLRELTLAATETGNVALLDGALGLLKLVDPSRRDWTIEKIIDALTGLGPRPWLWQSSALIPQLQTVVDRFGEATTAEQILRIVSRGDTYSRAGFEGLVRLYDSWPDHARGLDLPAMFRRAGIEEIGWYCAARECYPHLSGFQLWNAFGGKELTTTRFGDVDLRDDDELDSRLWSKWPNRGNSVLLDNLVWMVPTSVCQ